MAIRFTRGSSERVERTSGVLDYNSDYTICGWFRRSSSGTYQGILSLRDNISFSWENADSIYATNADVWRLASYNGGTGVTNTASDGPVVDTWYHVCLRRSGSTVDFLVDGVVTCTASVSPSGRSAVGAMTIGEAENVWYLDGRCWGFKAWSRALTTAEVSREMRSAMPNSASSLYGVWPFLSNNRPNDYSGNARDWTETNTPSDEDPPNVAFRLGEPIVILPAGASTSPITSDITGTGTLAGTLTGTGALTSSETGTVSLVGTLTGTGALTSGETGTFTVNATLTGLKQIPDTNLTGTGALTGTLIGVGSMTGVETATATLVGTLRGDGAITTSITGTGTLVGSFSSGGIATSLEGTVSLVGSLSGSGALITGLTGTLTLVGYLNGGAVGVRTEGFWDTAFVIPPGAEWRIVLTGDAANDITARVAPTFYTITQQHGVKFPW